jgi:hypothetical protein
MLQDKVLCLDAPIFFSRPHTVSAMFLENLSLFNDIKIISYKTWKGNVLSDDDAFKKKTPVGINRRF